jgi:hypothetical protein
MWRLMRLGNAQPGANPIAEITSGETGGTMQTE